MSIFNKQKIFNVLKTLWIFFIALTFLVIFARGCCYEIFNLIIPTVLLNQIESPSHKYVLTGYRVDPFTITYGGRTYLDLRQKNKRMKYVGLNPLTGNGKNQDGIILVYNSEAANPVGIVWLDDNHLLVNLMIPKS